MPFTVEQGCPQCGAFIDLDETDHLLRCPYCGVSSYLYTPDYYRLVLPHKKASQDPVYAPYFRFRGTVYYCSRGRIGHKVLDFSHPLNRLPGLPPSLGVRPQSLKLFFLTPEITGRFLQPDLNLDSIMHRVAKLSSLDSAGAILHRAYVGEVLSLVFMPLFVQQDGLQDGITGQRLGPRPEGLPGPTRPTWHPRFLVTLCPRCGWNLEGEGDSVVLLCTQCDSAWEADGGEFQPVEIVFHPSEDRNVIYLPFWQMEAAMEGPRVSDGLSSVLGLRSRSELFRCLCPAFKIRPKIFLMLARSLIRARVAGEAPEALSTRTCHPVTLPRQEAIQTLKVLSAACSAQKQRLIALLPQIRFRVLKTALLYLPFHDQGPELVQPQLRLGVNKAALRFGRFL